VIYDPHVHDIVDHSEDDVNRYTGTSCIECSHWFRWAFGISVHGLLGSIRIIVVTTQHENTHGFLIARAGEGDTVVRHFSIK
jgi:hypothetical protein